MSEDKKEEIVARRKRHEELVAAARKEMSDAFEAVAGTESGKKVLRYLHNVCGFDKIGLVMKANTGEVDPIATTYNECRRMVYIQMRAFLSTETLKQIEYPNKEEEKK